MMTRSSLLTTCLALFLGTAAMASAQDATESHLAAAEELLMVADTETVMQQSMDSMIELQLEQNPTMVQFEDILREFFDEHLSWDAVRDDLVQLYVETFTEEELRDVTAFYRTETGRTFIRELPKITARGMEIGQRAAAEHQGELQARIMERMQEGEQ